MSRTCPQYIVALLKDLSGELERVQWNINQEEYESPFQNTGNEFKTDVFEVHAYYWGDDEKLIDRPNFKCGDVEISWYKRLGRGTTINKRISRRKMEKIYLKCLVSILQWEYDHDDDTYSARPIEKEEIKELKGYRNFRLPFYKRLFNRWKYRKMMDDDWLDDES